MNTLRIAGGALNQTPLDWSNNLNNITQSITEAKALQINILLLPEMCIPGYGCEDMFLHDWVTEKCILLLTGHIAPLCTGMAVSVGLPIRYEGKLYNCCCLIDDGKILGFVAKQFLAIDGVHYENRWFHEWPAGQAGEIEINGIRYPFGDLIFNVMGVRVGYEICEDAWRADTRPAHRLAARGIDLIMNPSASPFAMQKSKIREKLVSGTTEIFDCTYLYANLLGNESGRLIFDGEMFISQKGKIIQRNRRNSFKNINIMWADVDLHARTALPATLPDDPQEAFQEFTEAAGLALFDYLRKSKSSGFALSLSGGADSSACAVLVYQMVLRAVDELGPDEFVKKINLSLPANHTWAGNRLETARLLTGKLLTCVYQGTVNSSEDTDRSARELADELGAVFYRWDIDTEVQNYTQKIENAIGRELTWATDDIVLQNIQARVRAPGIWMLANLQNALLLTTSNRSEGDVGYATMDGDTAGSIAPIAGVPKDFIKKWLIDRELIGGIVALKYVNSLAPSAELRPLETGQTDEKDLMPYAVLLEIERQAILYKKPPDEVFELLKITLDIPEEMLKEYVKKFFRLWARSQWKRERLAPSFHLDEFNVDPRSWCRFPILSGGFAEDMNF